MYTLQNLVHSGLKQRSGLDGFLKIRLQDLMRNGYVTLRDIRRFMAGYLESFKFRDTF